MVIKRSTQNHGDMFLYLRHISKANNTTITSRLMHYLTSKLTDRDGVHRIIRATSYIDYLNLKLRFNQKANSLHT